MAGTESDGSGSGQRFTDFPGWPGMFCRFAGSGIYSGTPYSDDLLREL